MKKTLGFVLALALSLTTTVAQASTIAVFGQNVGGNTITGTRVAGTTTITADDVLSTISVLNETGVNVAALFDFYAISTAAAVDQGGGIYTQTYDGSFSLTSGGFNYLSGVFSGVALGIDGGGALIFGAAQPPGSLVFTSDVVGMPLGFPTAMTLGFTNASNISVSNSSFNSFTSNVSGNFSAQSVPDGGATLALLGFAFAGLGAVRRKLA